MGGIPAARKAFMGGTACADARLTVIPWKWIGQSDQNFCITTSKAHVPPDRVFRLAGTSSPMSICTGRHHIRLRAGLVGASRSLVGALVARPLLGTARGLGHTPASCLLWGRQKVPTFLFLHRKPPQKNARPKHRPGGSDDGRAEMMIQLLSLMVALACKFTTSGVKAH